MTTAPDPPQLRTVLALRRLGSALAATNRAVGGALGIKDTDLAVLDVLHQEGPLTPTQLARRTRTHPATMTGVLGRLERGGWIERRPDAADRRSVRIRAAGVSRLAEVYARADEELAGLTADWSDERVAALIGFLDEASGVANRLADDLAPGGGGPQFRPPGRYLPAPSPRPPPARRPIFIRGVRRRPSDGVSVSVRLCSCHERDRPLPAANRKRRYEGRRHRHRRYARTARFLRHRDRPVRIDADAFHFNY